jgi:hypothetical protein
MTFDSTDCTLKIAHGVKGCVRMVRGGLGGARINGLDIYPFHEWNEKDDNAVVYYYPSTNKKMYIDRLITMILP